MYLGQCKRTMDTISDVHRHKHRHAHTLHDIRLDAREKFMSLRKSTKFDDATATDEGSPVAHIWHSFDSRFMSK
ncbi:hypothetical protein MTR_5g086990 [Medicago truncatula]|uniref:Uncharacterized protein n=1 Tax=Medicago truncatula TaxID=3880 RepID=G7KHD2_MEDTR|nr:hypothetical protein MTR_5g086990 [Medicago truncatula]